MSEQDRPYGTMGDHPSLARALRAVASPAPGPQHFAQEVIARHVANLRAASARYEVGAGREKLVPLAVAEDAVRGAVKATDGRAHAAAPALRDALRDLLNLSQHMSTLDPVARQAIRDACGAARAALALAAGEPAHA